MIIIFLIVFITEEDEHAIFSRLFIKYFLAEGVVCSHGLYVASLDDDPSKIVSKVIINICHLVY